MANLNSSGFLNCWQIVYRATLPSPDCERWHASGVDWRRQRHTYMGGGYSFTLEVHTLAFAPTDKPHWSLMVVVEHWRQGDKDVLRSTTWARRLSGSTAAITSWAKNHEAVRRATR
ncbi:MAG TPA: hypothetical protein VLX09_20775 [Stellaceae bacterium]|nr:hypothetical protein [Stellaceae bacterium]